MGDRAVVSVLLADEDVAELIGTNVHPATTTQTLTRPNVVYQRIGTERVFTRDGPTNKSVAYVQVGCWADTYTAAKQLANVVREALNGYRGTAGTMVVDYINLEDEDDFLTPPMPGGGSSGVYGVRQDYKVHFTE